MQEPPRDRDRGGGRISHSAYVIRKCKKSLYGDTERERLGR